ncbi:MAG: hydantoinase B/oxoprolinase family protein [Candidatus Dadabacteria bacterium]|nr:hydantoinase B/oxoprolinase family protein [Candidatus Dadabacteria bacterium]NIS07230.1 hydantoinase B/oxoprolinase family protein [Candidatus Dadabacteria bacterium]NIV40937.1 hydantoinase B/oxoprolinase family protein [Candidatus Dadabacteria bacterium]NIX14369.1 hydantoinase B/oxoprolinase family protein [Candidatus Dadabacteria bacterium]NIY20887.1 hydantoinase B/oxoprolinase family protein [Candidatus Dadabacteria bacterium]
MSSNKKLSPYEIEIFNNMLGSIAEEMGAVLIKAAYSPNIKERRDLSCAIFEENGEMVSQAAHIPVHLGSMSFAVKSVLSELDLNQGDVLIVNDPYRGGTHLPDITIIAPFYYDGKIQYFLASRAHHADVGGITPGSMPLSNSIHEEGVIIPPSKLYSADRLNRKLFNKIINSTRDPEERKGDFNAQIGAVKLGLNRLGEVVEKYSLSKIRAASDQLLDYSERMMKRVIKGMKNGAYSFTDYLDGDGYDPNKIEIDVKLAINKDMATVDFAGSSKQVEGCLNCPLSVTTSAVLYVFQCLAPKELPLNSGSLRPIRIVTERGTVVDAEYPGAVAGGNVETSQRIVDAVFGALSKAMPDKVPAASAGTMNNLTIGGRARKGNGDFAYYETIAGGMGARKGMDGISAVQTHMTNTLNTPIESLERELPILVDSYSIRKNSGGKGRYNGGDGIVRSYKFLTDVTVTLITDRRKTSPYGIKGGANGRPGRNSVAINGNKKVLPAKNSLNLKKGSVLTIETPGGGGWGRVK